MLSSTQARGTAVEPEFWQRNVSWFACPECSGELTKAEDTDQLICSRGMHRWSLQNGIPDFLGERSDAARFYDTEYWAPRCRQEINKLDRFYLGIVRQWIECLGIKPGMNYLDVSCGEGHTLAIGTEMGADAAGIEFSTTAVQSAWAKFRCNSVILADATHLPIRNEVFDRVSCLGSLEHYENPTRALAEIKRIAKCDAQFLFVVPNQLHPFAWLLKRLDPQVIRTCFDLAGWQEFLRAHGFRVLSYGADNHTYYRPVFPFSVKGLIRRSLAPIVRMGGLQMAWQFYFLCDLNTD